MTVLGRKLLFISLDFLRVTSCSWLCPSEVIVVYIFFDFSTNPQSWFLMYCTDKSGDHISCPAHQPIAECELSQCHHLDPVCVTGEYYLPTPQPVPGPDVSAGKP